QRAAPDCREAAQAARGSRGAGCLTMFDRLAPMRVLEGCTPETLPVEQLLSDNVPTVMPGLVRDCSLVRAGIALLHAAMGLVREHYGVRPVQYCWGEPSTAGRPFYGPEFTELNCQVRRGTLDRVLDELAGFLDDP